mmetsp:Transcript_29421/g.59319  ORF Transcript_29421/g.59319 Transcript_29421/m.59319 type:complete len:216 (-) Transcript_29421:189-836(-)
MLSLSCKWLKRLQIKQMSFFSRLQAHNLEAPDLTSNLTCPASESWIFPRAGTGPCSHPTPARARLLPRRSSGLCSRRGPVGRVQVDGLVWSGGLSAGVGGGVGGGEGGLDEELLHAVAALCRHLEEQEPVLLGVRLGILLGDRSPPLQIRLVAHKHNLDVVAPVLLQLIDPKLRLPIRLLVGNIVHQQSDMSAVVVQRSQRSELLLSGSIPNFKL